MLKTTGFMIVLWGGLLIAAAVAAEPTAAPSPVAKELQGLFDAASGRGANVLSEVQKRYAASRKAVGDDARLDFAYGLILLKQIKHKEAVAQFQFATQRKGEPHWPAWQALVWGHFAAKDYTAGSDRMTEMARRLAAIANEDDSPEVRRSIEWLGQMVGALGKVADAGKQRDAVVKVDAALQELFSGDELALYEAGKREVGAVASDVTRDAEELQKKLDAKDEEERKKKLEGVNSNLEASKEKRDSLKRSAEDWKAWLAERLDASDKQLSRLEKDYAFLEKRAQSLVQSQLQVQAEISLLTASSAVGQPGTAPGTITPQMQLQQQQIQTLQAQQVAYQLEYDRTSMSGLAVSQQASRVVQERMASVKQYEKATGNLVKQESALGKWEERMKKDGEKLKKAAKDKSAGSTKKSAAPKTLRSYVDLNWIIERDRLLEAVGVGAEAAAGRE